MKFAKTLEQVHASTYPCVVICGVESINSCTSIKLLSDWSGLKDSLILFTKSYSHYSLANGFAPRDGKMDNSSRKLTFLSRERVPLSKSEILKLEERNITLRRSSKLRTLSVSNSTKRLTWGKIPTWTLSTPSLNAAEKQLTMKKVTSPTLMQKIYWPEFSLDAHTTQSLHFLRGFLSSSQATFFHFNDFQYLLSLETPSSYGYLWSSDNSTQADAEPIDNPKIKNDIGEIRDDF